MAPRRVRTGDGGLPHAPDAAARRNSGHPAAASSLFPACSGKGPFCSPADACRAPRPAGGASDSRTIPVARVTSGGDSARARDARVWRASASAKLVARRGMRCPRGAPARDSSKFGGGSIHDFGSSLRGRACGLEARAWSDRGEPRARRRPEPSWMETGQARAARSREPAVWEAPRPRSARSHETRRRDSFAALARRCYSLCRFERVPGARLRAGIATEVREAGG